MASMWIYAALVLQLILLVAPDSYHEFQTAELKDRDESTLNKHDWKAWGQRELQQALEMERNMNVAKNVIIFIGDGMGISTVSAARLFNMQMKGISLEDSFMSWEKFPHVGLSRTYCTDKQTSDSAATATAFLCGEKTTDSVVGVSQDTPLGDCAAANRNPIKSILTYSQEKGKHAGVVSSARITHATPAAAYAHSGHRNWEGNSPDPACKDIARQLVEDNPEIRVILGGGRVSFLPKGSLDEESNRTYSSGWSREDDMNLIELWKEEKRNRSIPEEAFKYVDRNTTFYDIDPEKTDYLLGLFNPSHMEYEADRMSDKWGEPSLAELTRKSIEILRKNKDGFFLEVEGGRIDHGHHDTNAYRALMDTVAFSDAVQTAVEMTSAEDTLIVVTADHSHVFTIGGYPSWGNPIMGVSDDQVAIDGLPYTTLAYANGPGISENKNRTTGERFNLTNEITSEKDYLQDTNVHLDSETHGGEDVGIWARGPMAYLFHGSHEQSYIAHVMMYAFCVGPNQKHCDGGDKLPPGCPPIGSGADTNIKQLTIVYNFHMFVNLLFAFRRF